MQSITRDVGIGSRVQLLFVLLLMSLRTFSSVILNFPAKFAKGGR